jgi:hypothetical protein
MRKFHPIQRKYLEAKAAYDRLTAEATAKVGEYTGREDDEEAMRLFIERECDIYKEMGWIPAWKRWSDAEAALMAWALAIIKTLPDYNEEFAPIFTTPLLTIRTTAISIALKLEVPEEN